MDVHISDEQPWRWIPPCSSNGDDRQPLTACRSINLPLMRTFGAYLVVVHLLLSALASGGVFELLRAPSMCDHYEEHVMEAGGRMTWGGFLLLHFTDPDHERSDRGRHGELPFHNTGHAPVVFQPEPPALLVVESNVAQPYPIRSQEVSFGDLHRLGVFQPPRGTC